MQAVRTLGLLLIDGFALMSYASVIEPFRAANALAGAALYRWVSISVDGGAVSASSGANINAEHCVGDALACDTMFVFAAGDPSAFQDERVFRWLRQLGAQQVALAGVSGGPYLLARAGLLDGHRATIHWEHAAAFREAFPALEIETGLYVIDRRRMTCAGGTAGLDLAIELIERDYGHALASRVGEWFIRTAPRSAGSSQRPSLRERYGIGSDPVLRTLAIMEANVEVPRPRRDLAAAAGLSVRHLERLFMTHLGRSVSAAYMAIRLDQALHLLRSTGLTVTEIGVASGFQSSSHFSRIFKARFGHPPRRARATGRRGGDASP